jgi:hypothetical protein
MALVLVVAAMRVEVVTAVPAGAAAGFAAQEIVRRQPRGLK